MTAQRVRYPRTPHLPDSPGRSGDDRVIASLDTLRGARRLVVTEKMDGENTTLARHGCWARSPNSGRHPSRGPVRALWAARAAEIPDGYRVVGENLYARRSVTYPALPGWLCVFAVFDHHHTMLSWPETETWAALLDLPTVPVLYAGDDFDTAVGVWAQHHDPDRSEGFVIRDAGDVPADRFDRSIAKWVRADHVRTVADWRHRDDFATNTLA